LPTSSNILYGIEEDGEIMKVEYDIPADNYEELISQLQNNRTFWTIL
jgi:hypothetical protein